MSLDEIKMRAVCQAFGTIIESNQKPHEPTVKPLSEGKKEGKPYQTPKFVRDCVSAISERPKDLKRVLEKGSPFAICYAKYNANKKSLAAKHSKGEHHSDADFERSKKKLKKLRESHDPRNSIRYIPTTEDVEPTSRRQITYRPQ